MTPAHRALSALATTSPEYGPALTDHTAMAVEALERLAPEAIDAFVARYVPRLRPLADEPSEALAGFASRVREERAALAQHALTDVLSARTLDVLGPSLAGAAFHGAIRVGHAVRALARDSSPVRLDELARALAYASSRDERLPPALPADLPPLFLSEALAILPSAPDALVHVPGLITGTLLARATAHPTLRAVAGRLRLDDDPAKAAAELRRAAVHLLVEGESHPASLFTLLHGVTGMDAVCALVPHLRPEAAQALVGAAGHALLAVRVGYVGRLAARALPPPREPFAALVARAVATLDDHAIKLAAALAEAQRTGSDLRNAVALSRWLDALASREESA